MERLLKLYQVGQYAEAVLPRIQTIPTELNSPLAAPTTCQMYDPWFAKNRAHWLLLHDLILGGLSVNAGLPFLIAGEIQQGEVTSIKQLVEDGKLIYSPNKENDKYSPMGLLNLGPLVGVPCQVSYVDGDAKRLGAHGQGLHFLNLRFNTEVKVCHSLRTREIYLSGARDEDGPQETSGFEACARCTLELTSEEVISSTLFFVAQTGLDFVPLLGAVARFVRRITHSEDIPRTIAINPSHVLRALDTYGSADQIPNHCKEMLAKGLPCADDFCSASAINHFEALSGKRVLSSSRHAPPQGGDESSDRTDQAKIWLKVEGCPKSHVVYEMRCWDQPSIRSVWVQGTCDY